MVEMPDSVASIPCLKTLHFSGRYPFHSCVVHCLISCSPVLEVLHLRGVLEPDIPLTHDISVPTLKTLHLDFRIDEVGVHRHYINIDTPKLEYLRVKDDSLAEFQHIRPFFVLLQRIAKTKHLSLSANSIAVSSISNDDSLLLQPLNYLLKLFIFV
ncbi:hypothetical protein RDABS01_010216 [Bienertia sinuspersici]